MPLSLGKSCFSLPSKEFPFSTSIPCPKEIVEAGDFLVFCGTFIGLDF
jgi:hypothetical protein